MTRPTNPILPGFNPDPSIVRVGDVYYVAASTFEWYPGVAVHASTDLVNWSIAARPLDRAGLLDLRGRPDSGGVWAPCLTHADGRFHLVYTDMIRHQGNYKDCRNYLTTAERIEGPWSDPVYLNGSGFDPSLFHDEDGRKYLVNVLWDPFAPHPFTGIGLQEYDPAARRLVGPVTNIFAGTALAYTEAPHLYRRDGWYYLLTAEGGTWYDHACTLARSRRIEGPYEVHPHNPILTSRDDPGARLQRAGHGDIVESPDGRVYLVHLCSRRLGAVGHSTLGRETAIQECEWRDDGWLHVLGGPVPSDSIGSLPPAEPLPDAVTYAFDTAPLHPDLLWLRTPESHRIFEVLPDRGGLRLYGRESLGSWNEVALVARRQDVPACSVETLLSFSPDDPREGAGIIAYYSRHAFHALCFTRNAARAPALRIISSTAETFRAPQVLVHEEPLPSDITRVGLRMQGNADRVILSYRLTETVPWKVLPQRLDGSILADEGGRAVGGGGFTGTFYGLFAYDLNGAGKPADFHHFTYRRDSVDEAGKSAAPFTG